MNMYEDTFRKIKDIADELKLYSLERSYRTDLHEDCNTEDELKAHSLERSYSTDSHEECNTEIEVLMHLLLANSVNIVDCSFVKMGIINLAKRSYLLDHKRSEKIKNISIYSIEKNLCYFSSNKTNLLSLHFVFYDDLNNQQFLIEADEFVRSSIEGNFLHPVSLEPVRNFKKYIYPVYFPTEKLKEFRKKFVSERECQIKDEQKSTKHNSRNDRAERARALRIIRE